MVTANALSKNGKVEIVQVQFAGQAGDEAVNNAVPVVRSDATKFLAGSGLNVGLTGSAPRSVDTNAAYDHAKKIIGIATIILIVVLLGLIFRSPIAAVLPIVVILLIHSVTQSLTAALAKGFGFNVGNRAFLGHCSSSSSSAWVPITSFSCCSVTERTCTAARDTRTRCETPPR